MPITNYSELQTAVARWMHRNNLTGDIPDFITLAEARIKALLKLRLQSVVATLPTVLGTAYVSAPADMLKIRSMAIPNVRPAISYVTPDQFNAGFADQRSGSPYNYTIIGNLIYFGPVPDAIYPVSLVYEAKFTPLSDTEDTNALLTDWPNVYLWGAMKEAANFARNAELEDRYELDFQRAVADANALDWNTPGPLRMRTDTYTP